MNNAAVKRAIQLKKWISPAVFAFFAIAAAYSVFHHEPWRDEAQAWLIARDCNLTELFQQMTYEGHPALWQLVLFPFARLGAPFWVCYVINYIFYLGFLYLVIYRCTLPVWQRIAGLCACPVIVYSYQARSYMLMFLLLAICAAMYPVRKKKPVLFAVFVFLLANVHAHAVGAAGAMFLCVLIDFFQEEKHRRKKYLLPLAIMLSGFTAFLVQTIPSLGKNQYVTDMVPIKESGFSAGSLWESIDSVFLSLSQNIFVTYGEPMVNTGKTLFMLLFFVGGVSCLFSLRRAAVFAGAVLLPFGLLSLLYSIHAETLLVFLFFAVWVMQNEKISRQGTKGRIPQGAFIGFSCFLCGLLLFAIPHAKYYWEVNNAQRNTSGSIQAAEFLNREEYKDAVIVAEYPPQATAFAPMLKDNKKPWYAYIEDYGSYVSWTAELKKNCEENSSRTIVETIGQNFAYGEEILVVFSRDVPFEETRQLEKLFETQDCPVDESYCIYQFVW